MDTTRRIPSLSVLSTAGLLAITLWTSPAGAQTPPAPGTNPEPGATGGSPGVGVSVTPPAAARPSSFIFEWSLPPEEKSPPNDYGERTRTIFQPAFVNGASRTTRTSRTSGIRYGLSGWTAPRIPFDDRDSSGFPAIGLTIEWGVPMEPPAEPATPGQR